MEVGLTTPALTDGEFVDAVETPAAEKKPSVLQLAESLEARIGEVHAAVNDYDKEMMAQLLSLSRSLEKMAQEIK